MSRARQAPRSWRVGRGDAGSLHGALSRVLADPSDALASGRVFVDGRRQLDGGTTVREGAHIEVGAPRPMTALPSVMLERAGLLAVDKPAGLATEPERSGTRSVREYLEQTLGRPCHALSRLDLGVSGVVLFASTVAARRHVEAERSRGSYVRCYLALAKGELSEQGAWAWAVQEREALTLYRVVSRAAGVCLLALAPRTGRHHQLRVHASLAGAPLLGDRAHGGARTQVLPSGAVVSLERIALHCAALELTAPDGSSFVARAPIAPELLGLWSTLGGDESVWDRAVELGLAVARSGKVL